MCEILNFEVLYAVIGCISIWSEGSTNPLNLRILVPDFPPGTSNGEGVYPFNEETEEKVQYIEEFISKMMMNSRRHN